jgi:hypothetical protein
LPVSRLQQARKETRGRPIDAVKRAAVARGRPRRVWGELASTSEALKTKAIADSVCKESNPLCKLL